MALRFENGDLWIVESTGEGVIKTAWDPWIKNVRKGESAYTWHPLSKEARSKWNNTAAIAF